MHHGDQRRGRLRQTETHSGALDVPVDEGDPEPGGSHEGARRYAPFSLLTSGIFSLPGILRRFLGGIKLDSAARS